MTEIENLYNMKEIFEIEVIPLDLITTCSDVYYSYSNFGMYTLDSSCCQLVYT